MHLTNNVGMVISTSLLPNMVCGIYNVISTNMGKGYCTIVPIHCNIQKQYEVYYIDRLFPAKIQRNRHIKKFS